MSSLEILEERLAGNIAYISLVGSLDAHTHDPLKRAIDADLGQKVRRFILELSRLDYISSAGINLLTSTSKSAREQGGDLVLLRINPKIRQILDVLCLTPLFSTAETRDGAIRKLGTQPGTPPA